MARVFLSYRRADGPYAVGWIAERLSRLDEITEVSNAFYDTELRAGDRFPAALDGAVADSDVVVAVIGPDWHGERRDGTSRIQEADDWVARELASAFDHDKIVLPVLIGGADPLRASSLPTALAPLVDLHSLRLDGLDDLDEIERHLHSHLDDIDRRQAVERGLSEPLAAPSLLPRASILLGAVLAAVAGGLAGWRLFDWFGDGTGADPASLDRWSAATAALWSVSSAGAVIGVDFVLRRFRDGVRIRWFPVLLAALGAIAILGWTGLQPAAVADGRVDVGQWVGSAVAVVLMSPWALALAGTAWTEATADDRDLGSRASVIGRLSQASLTSAGAIAIAAVPGVFTTAYAGAAVDRSAFGEQIRIVGQGGLYTGLLIAILTWSRTRLERSSVELRSDLSAVPVTYRRHAEPMLVTEPFDERARWIVPLLTLPLVTSIFAALLISG